MRYSLFSGASAYDKNWKFTGRVHSMKFIWQTFRMLCFMDSSLGQTVFELLKGKRAVEFLINFSKLFKRRKSTKFCLTWNIPETNIPIRHGSSILHWKFCRYFVLVGKVFNYLICDLPTGPLKKTRTNNWKKDNSSLLISLDNL